MIALTWTTPPDDVDEQYDDREVLMTVDDADGDPTTVIADVSTDGAYIAMAYEESRTLSQWR